MPQIKTIDIKSRRDGFRRCGVAHSATPTWYAETAFSQEQWAQLKAEPMLVITHVPPAMMADCKLDEPVVSEDAETVPEEAEEDQARQIFAATRPAKLKRDLDRMGVEYPKKATKQELVDLLMANTAPVPDEVA